MCILLCRTLPGIELDRIASSLAIIPVRCGLQTQTPGVRVTRQPNHYFAATSAFGRFLPVVTCSKRPIADFRTKPALGQERSPSYYKNPWQFIAVPVLSSILVIWI